MTNKNELYETGEIGGLGDNIFTINAAMVNKATAYVYRSNADATHQWNGYVDYLEVTRAMNPLLKSITFDGTKIEVTSTTVSQTLPYATDLTNVTPEYYWNGAGTAVVTTNEGAWAWGVNTYVLTDKDGDASTYTITLTRAERSHDATLSDIRVAGVSIDGFDPATLTYNVELERGTSAYPAVTYTAATGATVAPSSDEFPGDYRLVVTAEDEETIQTYTIHFTVSTKYKVVIFDGTAESADAALATSPDATTGASWTVTGLSASSSSFTGYAYKIATGGGTGSSKNIAVTIPANYLPQFEITHVTNSNGNARNAMVGLATTRPSSTSDALFYVTNSDQSNPSTGTSEQLDEEQTYYIHSDNSINFLHISLLLEPILPKCEAPILSGLSDLDVCSLGVNNLSVTASTEDGGTFAYQWYKKGDSDSPVGTNSSSYVPTEVGQYYVVVTHSLADHRDNVTTSDVVEVTLATATEITTAPYNQRAETGNSATLNVAAVGKNISYKWYTCDNEAGDNPEEIVPAETGTSLSVTVTEGMEQWYKVVVTGDCGSVSATAKIEQFVPVAQANVTTSITWDWKSSTAGWPTAASSQIDFANTGIEYLMANVDGRVPNNEGFRSDMLIGKGQILWRNKSDGEYGFQGFQIKFHTEVAGFVRIYYRAPSSGNTCTITIDGKPAGSRGNSWGWSEYVEVEADKDILIDMVNSAGASNMTRVQKIEFEHYDHKRSGVIGNLGTICWPYNVPVANRKGADFFSIDYFNSSHVIFIEEDGELQAGRPYFFQYTDENMLIQNGETHVDDPSNYRGMYGTFTTLSAGSATDAILQGNVMLNNNNLYYAPAGCWLNAYRAYLKWDEVEALAPYVEPAGAPLRRRMYINMEHKTPTDLENIDVLNNLDGNKFIKDGKLYILRNGHLYNAQGVRVQ